MSGILKNSKTGKEPSITAMYHDETRNILLTGNKEGSVVCWSTKNLGNEPIAADGLIALFRFEISTAPSSVSKEQSVTSTGSATSVSVPDLIAKQVQSLCFRPLRINGKYVCVRVSSPYKNICIFIILFSLLLLLSLLPLLLLFFSFSPSLSLLLSLCLSLFLTLSPFRFLLLSFPSFLLANFLPPFSSFLTFYFLHSFFFYFLIPSFIPLILHFTFISILKFGFLNTIYFLLSLSLFFFFFLLFFYLSLFLLS